MKIRVYYFLILALSCHFKLYCQETTFFVQPVETNNAYSLDTDSHYVAIDRTVSHLDKLLLYIGGTKSTPKNTTLFLKLAANLGYHAIAITYPNSTSIQSACGLSNDNSCFEKFRHEACYGTPGSNSITIDSVNSLNRRAFHLIRFLDSRFSEDNWSQFINENQLNWNRITTAGHSQGAGHALYYAKTNKIDRCIMFSGANDFSQYFDTTANWISENFTTPKADIFCFLHMQDETGYQDQYKLMETLGLTKFGNGTLVDVAVSPYNNTHILYTNEEPERNFLAPYHNSTVVDNWTPKNESDNPIFLPVWEYLLTASVSSGNQIEEERETMKIYPNPGGEFITVEQKYLCREIIICNSFGKCMIKSRNRKVMNISILPPGIYFIQNGKSTQKFVKY